MDSLYWGRGSPIPRDSPDQVIVQQTPSHIRDHIDLIVRHEQEFLERRTFSERLGDSIGAWVGSLTFVVVHALWFAGWILVNTGHVGHIRQFDPFPYNLLDTLVAMEAIFLASFILMRQQRLGRRSDERDQLILQILLLTEKEITVSLGVQREIARKIGLSRIADNEEVRELSQHTSIEAVAENLAESLKEQQLVAE